MNGWKHPHDVACIWPFDVLGYVGGLDTWEGVPPAPTSILCKSNRRRLIGTVKLPKTTHYGPVSDHLPPGDLPLDSIWSLEKLLSLNE